MKTFSLPILCFLSVSLFTAVFLGNSAAIEKKNTTPIAGLNHAKGTLHKAQLIRNSENVDTYADWADPLIGTGNSRWMVNPGPRVPYGMIASGPDNQNSSWKAGYEYTLKSINGFSTLHDWATAGLLIMPTTGVLKTQVGTQQNPTQGYGSLIDKITESAKPGYYGVLLKTYNIKAELTTTVRSTMHRYVFNDKTNAKVLLDLHPQAEYSWNMTSGVIRKKASTKVEGYAVSNCYSTGYSGGTKYTLYFAMEFNKPISSMDGWNNGNPVINIPGDSIKGNNNMGAALYFNLNNGDTVLMRMGISFVSIDQAKLNLQTEIATPFGWSFDGVYQNARSTWNNLLSKISVETNDLTQKKKFYSNLYTAYCNRNTYNDVNGKYIDISGKTKQLTDLSKSIYGSDSYWGVQWDLVPLYNLITPHILGNWIHTFLDAYDVSGWIPIGNPANSFIRVMVGAPAVPMITAAYQNGYTNFDLNKASAAIRHQLTASPANFNGCAVGVENIVPYQQYKYIPNTMGRTSNTVEYAFVDYCYSQFAKALGDNTNYTAFSLRAGYWKNQFDPSSGYIRPKNTSGGWITPFNPMNTPGFTESNSMCYTWYVPQDPQGLVKTMGYDRFLKRLDSIFTVSAKMNFNAPNDNFTLSPINHGNQSSMQASYLFNWASNPWLTQKWARAIQNQYYGTSPTNAYLGDEDQGQMSSWFVLSSIGLFQMDGGASVNPNYEIGTPRFPKTVITTPTGKTFTILAKHASKDSCYVKSAKLNGVYLNTFRFPVSAYKNGGTLELEMTNVPVKANFEADKVIVTTKDTVHFYDVSLTEPASWSWSFTGGNPQVTYTSNVANPEIVFKNTGFYSVTLKNTNVFGGVQTVTKNMYIQVGTSTEVEDIQNKEEAFKAYFNSDDLIIQSLVKSIKEIKIEAINMEGKIILSSKSNESITRLPFDYPEGFYIVKIISDDSVWSTKAFKVNSK